MTQGQLNAVHITKATEQERHARLQLAAQQKAACLQRVKDRQQQELVVKNQKSFITATFAQINEDNPIPMNHDTKKEPSESHHRFLRKPRRRHFIPHRIALESY